MTNNDCLSSLFNNHTIEVSIVARTVMVQQTLWCFNTYTSCVYSNNCRLWMASSRFYRRVHTTVVSLHQSMDKLNRIALFTTILPENLPQCDTDNIFIQSNIESYLFSRSMRCFSIQIGTSAPYKQTERLQVVLRIYSTIQNRTSVPFLRKKNLKTLDEIIKF